MADKRRIITAAEHAEMEKKIAELNQQIVEVSEEVNKAREQGDLSENAEYAAAKTRRGQLMAELQRLDEILNNSMVVSVSGGYTSFRTGAPILIDVGGLVRAFTFTEMEGDTIRKKTLSSQSPIGDAIKGQPSPYMGSVSVNNVTRKYTAEIIRMGDQSVIGLGSRLRITVGGESYEAELSINENAEDDAKVVPLAIDSELGLKVYRDGVGTYSIQTDDGEVSVDVALMAAEEISI